MAFDSVRVKKVGKDDEDSFLDWDGRATLFDEDDDEEVEESDLEESEDLGDVDPGDTAEDKAGDEAEEVETDEDL